MHLRHYAFAAIALTATAAFAADGNFDRTLTISGAPTLSISTGSGYVHVYPGSGNQVHIVGHVHSRPGIFNSDADRAVAKIVDDPPIVQSGNTVTVAPPKDKEDLYRNVSIDYDVTAPASTTLSAHSGSGQIEIGGIQGTVSGATGSGSIHVDNIGGNAHLQTGSGSINATNVHGGATVQTGSGHINLAVTAPGDVKAQTGSGGMRLDGIVGSLRADAGSGGIDISGNPTGDWRAQSGSGGIHLQLPPDARLNLEASTGSGVIQVDRPIAMQTSANKHHVSGNINGGGPTVHLNTGSGGITLR
jgi:hypothetical protein